MSTGPKVYGARALKLLNKGKENDKTKVKSVKRNISIRPSEYFDTLESILLHLNLASEERGFSGPIKDNNSVILVNQIKFRCSSDHRNLKRNKVGRCEYYWIIEEFPKKKKGFKLVEVASHHNHFFGLNGNELDSDSSDEEEEKMRINFLNEKNQRNQDTLEKNKKLKAEKELAESRLLPRKEIVNISTSKHLHFEDFVSIESAVKKLASSCHLEFPTIENRISFTSHQEFRKYALLASISQINSSLYLSPQSQSPNTKLKNNQFILRCTSLDDKSRNFNRKCNFELKVVQVLDSNGSGGKKWMSANSPIHDKWCITQQNKIVVMEEEEAVVVPVASTSSIILSNDEIIASTSKERQVIDLSNSTASPELEEEQLVVAGSSRLKPTVSLIIAKEEEEQYEEINSRKRKLSSSPSLEILDKNDPRLQHHHRQLPQASTSTYNSRSNSPIINRTKINSESVPITTLPSTPSNSTSNKKRRITQLSIELEFPILPPPNNDEDKPLLNFNSNNKKRKLSPTFSSPPSPSISSSSSSCLNKTLSIPQLSSFLYSLSPTLLPYSKLLHSYGLNNYLTLVDLVLKKESDLDELIRDFIDYNSILSIRAARIEGGGGGKERAGEGEGMRRFQRILFRDKIGLFFSERLKIENLSLWDKVEEIDL